MSSFRVLNTFMLASAWLLTVFGATPCTIPWYNDESPPLSEISGFCVPKGDREACRHASLLPASSGGCPGMSHSSPLTEIRWNEAQLLLQRRGEAWLSRNAVLLSHVGLRESYPKALFLGSQGPNPAFAWALYKQTVKKSEGLGYRLYLLQILFGMKTIWW